MNWPRAHVMTVSGFDPRRDELVALYCAGEVWPGPVCVHDDPERKGVLFNHLRIMECAQRDVHDWSLVVQDDALWLPRWEGNLRAVMLAAPEPFVSLNHFGAYGARLCQRGLPFGSGVNCCWGQAVLYHYKVRKSYLSLVRLIAEMDAERFRKWDDGLISVYNLLRYTRGCFTARALVEHQDWKSTMNNQPGRWRKAERTIADPGPSWFAVPRSGGAPSASQIQREAARDVARYMRVRSQGDRS